jgi:hypothetical protein
MRTMDAHDGGARRRKASKQAHTTVAMPPEELQAQEAIISHVI